MTDRLKDSGSSQASSETGPSRSSTGPGESGTHEAHDPGQPSNEAGPDGASKVLGTPSPAAPDGEGREPSWMPPTALDGGPHAVASPGQLQQAVVDSLDMLDGRDRKVLLGRLTDGFKLGPAKLEQYSLALDTALQIALRRGDQRGINSCVRCLLGMVQVTLQERERERQDAAPVNVTVTYDGLPRWSAPDTSGMSEDELDEHYSSRQGDPCQQEADSDGT